MPRNPYDRLAKVPSFDVSSTDVKDGEELAVPHRTGIFGAGGQDVSPQLSWEGFPAGTQSFAITVYDPNAPTPSGFYHWAVMDIPVTTTSLERVRVTTRVPGSRREPFNYRMTPGSADSSGPLRRPATEGATTTSRFTRLTCPAWASTLGRHRRSSVSTCRCTLWAGQSSPPGMRCPPSAATDVNHETSFDPE